MTYSLSDLVGQPLNWHAAPRNHCELIAPDNSVLATLETSSPYWTSAKAVIPSGTPFPEGTFFLYLEENRAGFLGRMRWLFIVITAVEYSEGGQIIPLAAYKSDWPVGYGGELRFPDGHMHRWGVASFWGKEKVWEDSPFDKTPYINFSAKTFDSRVVINPKAAEIPDELSLLLVLGHFNILWEYWHALKVRTETSIRPHHWDVISNLFNIPLPR